MPERIKPIWRSALIIFFLSLAVRIIFVSVYIDKYDRYEEFDRYIADKPGTTHAMVKSESAKYYYRANRIMMQIKSGVSWFTAGGKYDIQGLYSRILALYGITTDNFQLNTDNAVPLNQLRWFLILQSLLFSVCLLAFYERMTHIIDHKLAFAACIFLAVEPTLAQYSAMIFTEPIFHSLLLAALSLFITILNFPIKERPLSGLSLYLIFGVLLGITFLQRSASMFWIIPFAISFLAQERFKISKSFIKTMFCMLLGYTLILGMLGMHNYYRGSFFYVMPTQAYEGWHGYFAKFILADINNSDPQDEVRKIELKAFADCKEKGIIPDSFDYDKRDVSRFNDYQLYQFNKLCRDQSFAVFLQHPATTLKIAIPRILKSLHLDPFYSYRLYSRVYRTTVQKLKLKYAEQTQTINIIKIIYSLFILIPTFIGWFFSRNKIPLPLNVLMTLSILYFIFTGGYYATSRYMVQNIIFYSIYWSIFMNIIIVRIKGRTVSV